MKSEWLVVIEMDEPSWPDKAARYLYDYGIPAALLTLSFLAFRWAFFGG
jgi:hypothetical protein